MARTGKKRIRAKVAKKLEDDEKPPQLPPTTRSSDEPLAKKARWVNKQRVLVFATRGISHRDRHLMSDIRKLMPNCKQESKMERRENLFVVNEICEMKNCNKAVLLEGRHQRDLYMWLANVPAGPSAKFLVENAYTMDEMKLTGNCLKGSRPLLSFDKSFEQTAHYSILKEILIQIFGVPNHHPKSQPFFDHVFTFSIADNRIWFRNFQILSEDGGLVEIGPRFVLNPIKIFDGSFVGQTLWENPFYVSPAMYRRNLTKSAASKYLGRVSKKVHNELTRPENTYKTNATDDIWTGDAFEKAGEIVEQEEKNTEVTADIPENIPGGKKKLKKKKKIIAKAAGPPAPAGLSKSPKASSSSPKATSVLGAKLKKLKNKKTALIKLKKMKTKAKAAKATSVG